MNGRSLHEAHHETGEAISRAHDLLSIARDVAMENEYLGSSAPEAMRILTLIEMAGEQVALAEERHEAEWRAAVRRASV